MSELSILFGDGKASIFQVEKEVITVGRAKDNDIILSDHTVSRKHAQFNQTSDGLLLKDLGSHNGTFVNGSRISKEHLLKHKDLVKIGASALTFLNESAQPATSPEKPKAVIEEPADQQEEEILVGGPGKEEGADKELLLSIKGGGGSTGEGHEPGIKPGENETNRISLLELEKRNKVLYVLFQISRKLNTVPDFDELLNSIMDSIFQVIDADHGFVAMLGEKPDELIPKVVKYRMATQTNTQELRVSRTIINKVVNEKASVLTSNAMEDDRFGGAKSLFLQNIRSVMSVPLWRKDQVIGIIQLDSFRLSNKFTKADLDLLTAISSQMAMVIEQANLNEKIRREALARNRLERFHSPEVVEMIISRGEDDGDEEALMAPKEKIATLLFTDIVSFTPLSERLSPTEISLLLNQYFRRMTDIIFDYRGTLDKYIGDAIMAVFGAPIEREDDAERAIMAALEMRRSLFEMMETIEPEKKFDIRLGINTGHVVAGNLGSPKRMDYSVLGDTVNTASRLESIAQKNQILIGEETFRLVKGK
ncbi:MAG: adenylate/guanylate cyclase domain-containing protein, partial [Pseudomonadota bacterium]